MSTSTCVHVCSFEGCDKTFSRRDRLIIHQRTHTGDRPYVCDCGKSYARSGHLTRHKETAHTFTVIQPFVCEEEGCNQTFTSKQSLKKHIKRRHEQKLYKCTYEDCNRLFHKHQHLTVHEYEHTNVKPFKCTHENCGKSFLLPSKLKQHMKVHSGYPCEEEGCEEKFDNWTSLRRHKYLQHPTIHTCTECDKTFTQKNAFQQHLKSHSEEREVFACPKPNCGRTYLEQRNLMTHIKSYHDGHRFYCEFEGCDRNFTTKQKCQKHFLLHQMKGTVPKKKSRKGIKKKSCAASITGVDAKFIKLDSMEDRIRLSESDSGMNDSETSHATESQLVQYRLESPNYPFNKVNEPVNNENEYNTSDDEIDNRNNSAVEIDMNSVQDITEFYNNPKLSSDLLLVDTMRNPSHVSEYSKQNVLENEQLSSDTSSKNDVLEGSDPITVEINQCHLNGSKNNLDISKESSVLASAISEINSQFCISDKTPTEDDTQYNLYHRGLCS